MRYKFWSILIDFASFSLVPPKWLKSLPTNHPFLFRSPETQCLTVARVLP
jgi:hypothetical protein